MPKAPKKPRRKPKAEPEVIVINKRTPPAVIRQEARGFVGHLLGVAEKHHGFDGPGQDLAR